MMEQDIGANSHSCGNRKIRVKGLGGTAGTGAEHWPTAAWTCGTGRIAAARQLEAGRVRYLVHEP